MRVILEFDGSVTDFERALCQPDDQFTLQDSIIWLLDYGEEGEEAKHRTDSGNITITKEGD